MGHYRKQDLREMGWALDEERAELDILCKRVNDAEALDAERYWATVPESCDPLALLLAGEPQKPMPCYYTAATQRLQREFTAAQERYTTNARAYQELRVVVYGGTCTVWEVAA